MVHGEYSKGHGVDVQGLGLRDFDVSGPRGCEAGAAHGLDPR